MREESSSGGCFPDTGMHADARFVKMCNETQGNVYPNAWGGKIRVYSNLNIQLWESLLQGYHDHEVVEWLKYGWPISRPPNWPDPQPTLINHGGAMRHPTAMEKYINKELNRKSICGPFDKCPFKERIGVSPLSTRTKRDSEERRVIMDLSWPPGGSVNDGIGKDQFLGFKVKLTFPTIDDIARRVFEMGRDAEMFKVDLSGYFLQLPVDPSEYSLLCFTWEGKFYFHIMSPMGLRSAPYFAQRTSNAIRYMHEQMGFFLFNYIDDFIGVEKAHLIWSSFDSFIRLLNSLGVRESIEKRIAPCKTMNCVGTLVDIENMQLRVLPDRMESLIGELKLWVWKEEVDRKELQSLIGKLQFICSCVRPGRIFMSRMIRLLKGVRDRIVIDAEFKKDVEWWLKYIKTFDGTSIIWMLHEEQSHISAATDASLQGLGGFCGKQYFKCRVPKKLRGKNYIAQLEMWAIVILFKIWSKEFTGRNLLIECDNQVVCSVLTSGRSYNQALLELMREVVYIACTYKFEYRLKYIESKNNVIPDLLSRWDQGESVRLKFKENVDSTWEERDVHINMFNFMHDW